MSLSRQLICSRYIAVLGFQRCEVPGSSRNLFSFPSAISRYLVSNSWYDCCAGCPARAVSIRYIAVLGFQLIGGGYYDYDASAPFPSAISRYLVSNPTRKTPPLTSGGGNGLHTPRRIDHIPTFASLNFDKNTRSTHYTPNAGIELSETTPLPLRVNPVQNHT